MNISCQNNAYVGRTHLTTGGSIDTSTIQAEIDAINSNLDTTNTNLDSTNSNLAFLQVEHDYTVGFIDSNLTPLTYLINTEITPASIIPPRPEIINTYIYNSNVLGEIRFWVKDTKTFPVEFPVGVPDYRVKIDVDGKLKLYYTYDILNNAAWGNG